VCSISAEIKTVIRPKSYNQKEHAISKKPFRGTSRIHLSTYTKIFFLAKITMTKIRKKDIIHETDRDTGFLYIIRPKKVSFIKTKRIPFKIGHTWHIPEKRLASIQSNHWTELVLDCSFGRMLSSRFHERTVLHHIRHKLNVKETASKEWFLLDVKEYQSVRKLMYNINDHYFISTW
jgi:hypothetical protein